MKRILPITKKAFITLFILQLFLSLAKSQAELTYMEESLTSNSVRNLSNSQDKFIYESTIGYISEGINYLIISRKSTISEEKFNSITMFIVQITNTSDLTNRTVGIYLCEKNDKDQCGEYYFYFKEISEYEVQYGNSVEVKKKVIYLSMYVDTGCIYKFLAFSSGTNYITTQTQRNNIMIIDHLGGNNTSSQGQRANISSYVIKIDPVVTKVPKVSQDYFVYNSGISQEIRITVEDKFIEEIIYCRKTEGSCLESNMKNLALQNNVGKVNIKTFMKTKQEDCDVELFYSCGGVKTSFRTVHIFKSADSMKKNMKYRFTMTNFTNATNVIYFENLNEDSNYKFFSHLINVFVYKKRTGSQSLETITCKLYEYNVNHDKCTILQKNNTHFELILTMDLNCTYYIREYKVDFSNENIKFKEQKVNLEIAKGPIEYMYTNIINYNFLDPDELQIRFKVTLEEYVEATVEANAEYICYEEDKEQHIYLCKIDDFKDIQTVNPDQFSEETYFDITIGNYVYKIYPKIKYYTLIQDTKCIGPKFIGRNADNHNTLLIYPGPIEDLYLYLDDGSNYHSMMFLIEPVRGINTIKYHVQPDSNLTLNSKIKFSYKENGYNVSYTTAKERLFFIDNAFTLSKVTSEIEDDDKIKFKYTFDESVNEGNILDVKIGSLESVKCVVDRTENNKTLDCYYDFPSIKGISKANLYFITPCDKSYVLLYENFRVIYYNPAEQEEFTIDNSCSKMIFTLAMKFSTNISDIFYGNLTNKVVVKNSSLSIKIIKHQIKDYTYSLFLNCSNIQSGMILQFEISKTINYYVYYFKMSIYISQHLHEIAVDNDLYSNKIYKKPELIYIPLKNKIDKSDISYIYDSKNNNYSFEVGKNKKAIIVDLSNANVGTTGKLTFKIFPSNKQREMISYTLKYKTKTNPTFEFNREYFVKDQKSQILEVTAKSEIVFFRIYIKDKETSASSIEGRYTQFKKIYNISSNNLKSGDYKLFYRDENAVYSIGKNIKILENIDSLFDSYPPLSKLNGIKDFNLKLTLKAGINLDLSLINFYLSNSRIEGIISNNNTSITFSKKLLSASYANFWTDLYIKIYYNLYKDSPLYNQSTPNFFLVTPTSKTITLINGEPQKIILRTTTPRIDNLNLWKINKKDTICSISLSNTSSSNNDSYDIACNLTNKNNLNNSTNYLYNDRNELIATYTGISYPLSNNINNIQVLFGSKGDLFLLRIKCTTCELGRIKEVNIASKGYNVQHYTLEYKYWWYWNHMNRYEFNMEHWEKWRYWRMDYRYYRDNLYENLKYDLSENDVFIDYEGMYENNFDHLDVYIKLNKRYKIYLSSIKEFNYGSKDFGEEYYYAWYSLSRTVVALDQDNTIEFDIDFEQVTHIQNNYYLSKNIKLNYANCAIKDSEKFPKTFHCKYKFPSDKIEESYSVCLNNVEYCLTRLYIIKYVFENECQEYSNQRNDVTFIHSIFKNNKNLNVYLGTAAKFQGDEYKGYNFITDDGDQLFYIPHDNLYYSGRYIIGVTNLDGYDEFITFPQYIEKAEINVYRNRLSVLNVERETNQLFETRNFQAVTISFSGTITDADYDRMKLVDEEYKDEIQYYNCSIVGYGYYFKCFFDFRNLELSSRYFVFIGSQCQRYRNTSVHLGKVVLNNITKIVGNKKYFSMSGFKNKEFTITYKNVFRQFYYFPTNIFLNCSNVYQKFEILTRNYSSNQIKIKMNTTLEDEMYGYCSINSRYDDPLFDTDSFNSVNFLIYNVKYVTNVTYPAYIGYQNVSIHSFEFEFNETVFYGRFKNITLIENITNNTYNKLYKLDSTHSNIIRIAMNDIFFQNNVTMTFYDKIMERNITSEIIIRDSGIYVNHYLFLNNDTNSLPELNLTVPRIYTPIYYYKNSQYYNQYSLSNLDPLYDYHYYSPPPNKTEQVNFILSNNAKISYPVYFFESITSYIDITFDKCIALTNQRNFSLSMKFSTDHSMNKSTVFFYIKMDGSSKSNEEYERKFLNIYNSYYNYSFTDFSNISLKIYRKDQLDVLTNRRSRGFLIYDKIYKMQYYQRDRLKFNDIHIQINNSNDASIQIGDGHIPCRSSDYIYLVHINPYIPYNGSSYSSVYDKNLGCYYSSGYIKCTIPNECNSLTNLYDDLKHHGNYKLYFGGKSYELGNIKIDVNLNHSKIEMEYYHSFILPDDTFVMYSYNYNFTRLKYMHMKYGRNKTNYLYCNSKYRLSNCNGTFDVTSEFPTYSYYSCGYPSSCSNSPYFRSKTLLKFSFNFKDIDEDFYEIEYLDDSKTTHITFNNTKFKVEPYQVKADKDTNIFYDKGTHKWDIYLIHNDSYNFWDRLKTRGICSGNTNNGECSRYDDYSYYTYSYTATNALPNLFNITFYQARPELYYKEFSLITMSISGLLNDTYYCNNDNINFKFKAKKVTMQTISFKLGIINKELTYRKEGKLYVYEYNIPSKANISNVDGVFHLTAGGIYFDEVTYVVFLDRNCLAKNINLYRSASYQYITFEYENELNSTLIKKYFLKNKGSFKKDISCMLQEDNKTVICDIYFSLKSLAAGSKLYLYYEGICGNEVKISNLDITVKADTVNTPINKIPYNMISLSNVNNTYSFEYKTLQSNNYTISIINCVNKQEIPVKSTKVYSNTPSEKNKVKIELDKNISYGLYQVKINNEIVAPLIIFTDNKKLSLSGKYESGNAIYRFSQINGLSTPVNNNFDLSRIANVTYYYSNSPRNIKKLTYYSIQNNSFIIQEELEKHNGCSEIVFILIDRAYLNTASKNFKIPVGIYDTPGYFNVNLSTYHIFNLDKKKFTFTFTSDEPTHPLLLAIDFSISSPYDENVSTSDFSYEFPEYKKCITCAITIKTPKIKELFYLYIKKIYFVDYSISHNMRYGEYSYKNSCIINNSSLPSAVAIKPQAAKDQDHVNIYFDRNMRNEFFMCMAISSAHYRITDKSIVDSNNEEQRRGIHLYFGDSKFKVNFNITVTIEQAGNKSTELLITIILLDCGGFPKFPYEINENLVCVTCQDLSEDNILYDFTNDTCVSKCDLGRYSWPHIRSFLYQGNCYKSCDVVARQFGIDVLYLEDDYECVEKCSKLHGFYKKEGTCLLCSNLGMKHYAETCVDECPEDTVLLENDCIYSRKEFSSCEELNCTEGNCYELDGLAHCNCSHDRFGQYCEKDFSDTYGLMVDNHVNEYGENITNSKIIDLESEGVKTQLMDLNEKLSNDPEIMDDMSDELLDKMIESSTKTLESVLETGKENDNAVQLAGVALKIQTTKLMKELNSENMDENRAKELMKSIKDLINTSNKINVGIAKKDGTIGNNTEVVVTEPGGLITYRRWSYSAAQKEKKHSLSQVSVLDFSSMIAQLFPNAKPGDVTFVGTEISNKLAELVRETERRLRLRQLRQNNRLFNFRNLASNEFNSDFIGITVLYKNKPVSQDVIKSNYVSFKKSFKIAYVFDRLQESFDLSDEYKEELKNEFLEKMELDINILCKDDPVFADKCYFNTKTKYDYTQKFRKQLYSGYSFVNCRNRIGLNKLKKNYITIEYDGDKLFSMDQERLDFDFEEASLNKPSKVYHLLFRCGGKIYKKLFRNSGFILSLICILTLISIGSLWAFRYIYKKEKETIEDLVKDLGEKDQKEKKITQEKEKAEQKRRKEMEELYRSNLRKKNDVVLKNKVNINEQPSKYNDEITNLSYHGPNSNNIYAYYSKKAVHNDIRVQSIEDEEIKINFKLTPKEILNKFLAVFLEYNIVASIFKKSLYTPKILKVCICIFDIMSIIGFNSILYTEKDLEKMMKLNLGIYLGYPLKYEGIRISFSIILTMILNLIMRIIIYIPKKEAKLLSEQLLIAKESDRKRVLQKFNKNYVIKRLISAGTMVFLIIIFSYLSIVFNGIYPNSTLNWFFGVIWCLFFKCILSAICCLVLTILKEENEEVYLNIENYVTQLIPI